MDRNEFRPIPLSWIGKDVVIVEQRERCLKSKARRPSRPEWRTEVQEPRRKAIFQEKNNFLPGWQREYGSQELTVKQQTVVSAQSTAKPCDCEDRACECELGRSTVSRTYFPVSNSSDPFARLQVPITNEIHKITDYFIEVWCKTAFRNRCVCCCCHCFAAYIRDNLRSWSDEHRAVMDRPATCIMRQAPVRLRRRPLQDGWAVVCFV